MKWNLPITCISLSVGYTKEICSTILSSFIDEFYKFTPLHSNSTLEQSQVRIRSRGGEVGYHQKERRNV